MKKMVLFVTLAIGVYIAAPAQSISFTGSVRNENGLPLSSALVSQKGTKTAMYVDSLGFFKININSNAVLIIAAQGYLTDTLYVGNDDKALIILRKGTKNLDSTDNAGSSKPGTSNNINTAQNQIVGNTLQDTYQNMFNGQTLNSAYVQGPSTAPTVVHSISSSPGFGNTFAGTFLPQFTHTEETRGSKYLFDKWVNGVVVDTSSNIIDNKNYLFNYNKISRAILMTEDMKSAIEVNKDQVKAFALKDQNGRFYIFEQVPGMESGNFVQQLVKGNKYYLYKSIKTKFVKSNYRTDGLTEIGNNYDEYVDEFRYYVLPAGSKEFKEIELKKKSVKSVFVNETAKVNTYFSQHADDSVDENFLTGLIIFLNQ